MSYPKEGSNFAKSWFETVLNLGPGDELYIPCDNKSKQASLRTRLYGARKEYMTVDPIIAEEITFSPVFRDGDPFIKAYRSKIPSNKGFIKKADGTIENITISIDKDRIRKILLMDKAGMKKEEIEKELGKLSDSEIMLLKQSETE